MSVQTLQQQTPIYHVCQQCGGDGCEACSDLCILDGDLPPMNVVGVKVPVLPTCQCDDPDAKHYCVQCHPYWGYGDMDFDPLSFEVGGASK
ncbi:hypothetical protein ACB289_11915 [Aeromonas caviae]